MDSPVSQIPVDYEGPVEVEIVQRFTVHPDDENPLNFILLYPQSEEFYVARGGVRVSFARRGDRYVTKAEVNYVGPTERALSKSTDATS